MLLPLYFHPAGQIRLPQSAPSSPTAAYRNEKSTHDLHPTVRPFRTASSSLIASFATRRRYHLLTALALVSLVVFTFWTRFPAASAVANHGNNPAGNPPGSFFHSVLEQDFDYPEKLNREELEKYDRVGRVNVDERPVPGDVVDHDDPSDAAGIRENEKKQSGTAKKVTTPSRPGEPAAVIMTAGSKHKREYENLNIRMDMSGS